MRPGFNGGTHLTIWKFPIPCELTRGGLLWNPAFCISMPRGAKVLTAQAQFGMPVIWALVDPNAPVVERAFLMLGTGHDAPTAALEYVGTIQLHDGSLVLHVFARERLGNFSDSP